MGISEADLIQDRRNSQSKYFVIFVLRVESDEVMLCQKLLKRTVVHCRNRRVAEFQELQFGVREGGALS